MKPLIIIAVILALLLSACGAKAAPTIDPAQVQASAISMASTMVAQTQAAIPPTPTFTDTPFPSPTPLPLPTLDISPTETIAPVATQSSSNTSSDPCNKPLGATSAGTGKLPNSKTGNVLIVNGTKAPITVSLYLALNKAGQCGYLSYAIAPSRSIFLANVLPYGCYYASALINDPKRPSQASGGPACITGPDKTTFTVTATTIKINGP